MSEKAMWWWVSVLVLLRTALIGWWPYPAQLTPSGESARILFQAMSLVDGEWLGVMANGISIVDPLLPLWVALLNFLGVPLLFAQHAFYTAMCAAAMLATHRLTGSGGTALASFAVLLFNPLGLGYASVATSMAAVLGQSLILGTLALATLVFADFYASDAPRRGNVIILAILVALLWLVSVHARMALVCACWFVVLSLLGLRGKGRSVSRRLFLWIGGTVITVTLVAAGLAAGIAWKNHQIYGIFAVKIATSEVGPPVERKTSLPDIVAGLGVFIHSVADIPEIATVEEVYSTGDPVSLLAVSRLVNTPVRADDSVDYFLPEFHKRARKHKTRYLLKLVDAMRTLTPALLLAGIAGMLLRLAYCIRRRCLDAVDAVLFGLCITALFQAFGFARGDASNGDPPTTRLHYIYPVLYWFAVLGIHALLQLLPWKKKRPEQVSGASGSIEGIRLL